MKAPGKHPYTPLLGSKLPHVGPNRRTREYVLSRVGSCRTRNLMAEEFDSEVSEKELLGTWIYGCMGREEVRNWVVTKIR